MKRATPPLLDEVLDFRPDVGVIRLHDQRVVILSSTAMGLLRRQLVDNLGVETARRLLLRFGYADGYHDAINLRDQSDWQDPIEGVRAGANLHALEGIVKGEYQRLEYDRRTGSFDAELDWHNSYEGEEHLEHFGRSQKPVCWSLVGYVSGYVSACLGGEIYFCETSCIGQGRPHCALVGRHADAWGKELGALRFDFQGADLGKEVERLRVAARRQKQALTRREQALARLEREMDLLRHRVTEHAASRHFVFRSAAMRDALELAARVAPLDTTVLITGESGTGKEFVARMIHEHSERARGPLVSVNCAALTETLLESELFGHVRGAFTGAVRDKPGLFEVAANGTLFLDEVGDMAFTLQAKVLRALQEGEIRRVGGERDIRIRPRIVAATNRNLRAVVAEGRFREDLYFRLGAFVIAIPPLRDRPEDVPVLVHEFLRQTAARLKKDVQAISSEAMTALVGHAWPGNVRELEHAIERAVILARGRVIGVRDLPPEVREPRSGEIPSGRLDLKGNEPALIKEALRRFRGNRRRAAAALNISPVTLWRKMKRFGIDTDDR
jgi:DNA-binding NtrC family response regulator